MEESTQTVTTTEEVQGKLVFGLEGIKNPTPVWATWAFRCTLLAWFMFKFMIAPKLQIHYSLQSVSDWKDYADWIMFASWALGRPLGIKKENIAKDLGLDIQ